MRRAVREKLYPNPEPKPVEKTLIEQLSLVIGDLLDQPSDSDMNTTIGILVAKRHQLIKQGNTLCGKGERYEF